jgi:hypothetical protein
MCTRVSSPRYFSHCTKKGGAGIAILLSHAGKSRWRPGIKILQGAVRGKEE